MLEYRAEGLCRNANHLSREELSRCMASGEVLQSTALAYDTGHRLRFELGGLRGIMPFADCVDAAPGETVKDIAVLTRVGRPTCFVIMGTEFDENGEEYYLLSRAEAQRRCRAQYLDTLEAGSVIPCTVTHIENFGAFCDIGCGIAALLPIDCLSVSRIASPADRVQVGQQLLCAIKNRDAQGRIVLPQKLRAYAHLEKDVVVIGVSNRAEIWNAERWAALEAEELNPENLAAVMEELGF